MFETSTHSALNKLWNKQLYLKNKAFNYFSTHNKFKKYINI